VTDKFKRPGSMGDTERALGGRRRRSHPFGVPTVEIDPELTPPPQEPPSPSSLAGYDSIPPPIARQLDMLSEGLGNVTTAIGKVWDARKDGERLDRVDSKLATLAEAATKHQTMLNDFVMPAIKDGMRSMDEVANQMPMLISGLESVTAMVSTVDNRLRQLEVEIRLIVERVIMSVREIEIRITAHDKRISDGDARLGLLERKERDKEVITKALARKERFKSGGLAGAVAALVGAVYAAISHLTK